MRKNTSIFRAFVPLKQLTVSLLVVSFLTPSLLAFAQESTTTLSGAPPPQTPQGGEGFGGGGGGESLLDSGFDGNPDVSRYIYSSRRADEVDKVTGAFTFEIPIITPPGRNGIEPKLALQYYSQPQTETSIVGYGWNISIPYIERINRTGTDVMFDVTYFSSSMSGELASTSATTYKAKVENGDFITYEYSNNVWTAKDKLGNVYKFGHSTSTRQDLTDGSSMVAKWMLEEIRDRNDNYITYTYFKNGSQIYPSDITYTHSSTTANGIFKVEFNRESVDNRTSAAVGFPVTTSYRIYEIVTKVNGTWVRKYDLDYSNPANRTKSLLTSVTEYGRGDDGATTTRPAYEFSYQESSPSTEARRLRAEKSAKLLPQSIPMRGVMGLYTLKIAPTPLLEVPPLARLSQTKKGAIL